MWEYLIWFRDRFFDLSRLLDKIIFNINGVRVSLLGLLLGFMFVGMIITVFWKGARA